MAFRLRLDQALVEQQLCPSRSKAKELILRGEVEVLRNSSWIKAVDPALIVDSNSRIRLGNTELLKYVSRAGLKLEKALEHTRLKVSGWRCLDVGQSTGGFSQVLLQNGAEKVIGLDVGHDQLHPSLKEISNLESIEGLNIKEAHLHSRLKGEVGDIDLAVADVSFISAQNYISVVVRFLKSKGHLLLLVKPQFELSRELLNKKGLVKDPSQYLQVESAIRSELERCGLQVVDYFESSLPGQDGNREFFAHAQKR